MKTGGKRTILVVDDDQGLCTELADFLSQKENWWVDASFSAQDALNKIKRAVSGDLPAPYDIIILDLQMQESGMSGFELLERLKREEELFQQLYIIVLSGYLNHKRIEEIKSLGASDFIRKRDLYDDLFARIEMGIHWQEQRMRLAQKPKINESLAEVASMLDSLKPELDAISVERENCNCKRLIEQIECIREKIAQIQERERYHGDS